MRLPRRFPFRPMPIYAYKCASCGFAKDVLQKISDPQLTLCPACGAEAFSKQVTAAGFQLKGSGWYATDFRNPAKPAEKAGEGAKTADAAGGDAKPAESKPAESKPADSSAAPASAPSPAPKKETPSASAGGRGGPGARPD